MNSTVKFTSQLQQELPGGVSNNKRMRFGAILFPGEGVGENNYMVRNLSRTLGRIPESTAEAIAPQGKSLNSLAQVVLDNSIALDNKLAEHRKVVFVPLLTTSVALL